MIFSTQIIAFSLILCSLTGFAQVNTETKIQYEQVFDDLQGMLSGTQPMSFRKAVFATEWAYLDGKLDTAKLHKQITFLSYLCYRFYSVNDLRYDKKDKEHVKRWGSIFTVMTDTIRFTDLSAHHLPFQYDFQDFFGEKDWSKMFVSKLLTTWSGNCHSLPYLYKMIAEDLGVPANLALAPNHIYIKHRSLKSGWYNTELTSAAFPIDAWIMASGYIHLEAIQNSVYLKALDDTESIALCMIDLAEGYKRKTGNTDIDFILKCTDTALQYFPNYINALILKAEALKTRHDRLQDKSMDYAKQQFLDMQTLYVRIHELGYRQMPKEMYMKWLIELKTEKEKYENKNVPGFTR